MVHGTRADRWPGLQGGRRGAVAVLTWGLHGTGRGGSLSAVEQFDAKALRREPDVCAAAHRLARVGGLSPREREVLGQAALGAVDQEIAGRMFVAHRTVRHYFTALFQKLGARSRVDVALIGLLAHVADCPDCQSAISSFSSFHGRGPGTADAA
jgi:DNA-binding CsgD family transcriptional regulator